MKNSSGNLIGNYGFQSVARNLAHGFSHPDKAAYSRQKTLPLVNEVHDDLVSLDAFNQLDFSIGASDLPKYLVRIWENFFARRVSAALEVNLEMPRLLSLFPGNTVLGAKEKTSSRYRGSLAFEQFICVLDYDKGAPYAGFSDVCLTKQRVDESPFWPWVGIEQPKLQFVTAEYDWDENAPRDTFNNSERKNSYLSNLYELACEALNLHEGVELACLRLIHSAWSDTNPPVYSKFAIAVASRLIEHARPRLNRNNLLPFLFEVESFASYETYVSRISPVASGWYSNTWLDVGFMPLTQIRATELCVSERLIQELFNLPSRGFAPVVVNEFDSVADGNHRVTSSWIWNILKHAMHTEWSLESEEFMRLVGEYVNAHRAALGSVSLYESLKQLAAFLADNETCNRLNHVLKPPMKRSRAIRKLPVVMLPEYSMGTVEKGSHDQHGVFLRVPPSLYAELAQTSDTVLPPRASYHFTDAVPMPWFEVVKQRRFNHLEALSEGKPRAERVKKSIQTGIQ